MVQNSNTPSASLIPPQPIPEGAHAFSKRLFGLMDGQPKDDATVAQALEGMDDMFERVAADMYTLASMLVGEGEAGVRLVETTVAESEARECSDLLEARKNSRRVLCSIALQWIERCRPGSLAAPEGVYPSPHCIEDDDLKASGVSGEELKRVISGPDRDRVRKWLERLPTEVRTVFVLRAVAGFTAAETVGLLVAHGGPRAAEWDTEAVRAVFRQGLCSLASQLIKTTARGDESRK
jgi:DNA-directed RNA polymerase specialized sigma24 family protein